MLTSIRRLISYPNPTTRTDPADVALYIANLVASQELDVYYSQDVLANRPISTVGSPGVAGRIFVATDQTPHQIFWDYGTGWDPVGQLGPGSVTYAMLEAALKPSGSAGTGAEALRALGTGANNAAAGNDARFTDARVGLSTVGTYAARPTAVSGLNGQFYYATDQDALYLCVAAVWVRMGDKAGDVIWTIESSQRTGYLICTGQAWPATTGIYADLFAKWGGLYPTTLPDLQSRVFVNKGTHADVATLGFNDGFAVGLRRMLHKHTRVFTQPTISRTVNVGLSDPGHNHSAIQRWGGAGSSVDGFPGYNPASTNLSTTTSGLSAAGTGVSVGTQPVHAASAGDVTIGPQTGNEPTDTEPYIVMQGQVKL